MSDGHVNYVHETFKDEDGKVFRKGTELTDDEYTPIAKHPFLCVNVARLSHEVAGRLRLRDVTPNKHEGADVHDEYAPLPVTNLPGKVAQLPVVAAPADEKLADESVIPAAPAEPIETK